MKKRMKQRGKIKLKLSGRLLLVMGTIGISLTLVIGWLVYLNIASLSRIKATGNNEIGGNHLNNNSEIISEFTWEKNPVTQSTFGPDAISVSSSAHSAAGGKASTHGLAPGTSGKNIDFIIASSPLFDQDGIDISLDYRRNEPSGNFFTRGGAFNFGMSKGFILIHFRVEDKKGGYETIRAITGYEIPTDDLFRNYRFIYDPIKGMAEIFVNSIIVWSYAVTPFTSLYWKDAGNITIGKDMDGGGKNIPVFDNLVIRSAGSVIPLAESLINFMPEEIGGNIRLHWSTTVNDRVNTFALQRSENGVDFTTIATVKANPDMKTEDEYMISDVPPLSNGIIYYRLRQNFKDGRFVVHHLSAIKLNTEKNANLCIEKVTPTPFEKTFDIAYFTPSSGRVWIQLTDDKGKIKSSETFEAARGKNIHACKDLANLESGAYTLHLIFGEKKVSTKVIKS